MNQSNSEASYLLCMKTGSPWQAASLSSAMQTPVSKEAGENCILPVSSCCRCQGSCYPRAAVECLESIWRRGDPSLSGPAVVHAPAAGGEPALRLLGEEVQLAILTRAARGGAEGEAKHSLQTRT